MKRIHAYRIISKNDELYHHGVKGMKWGVRHDRKRPGRSVYLKAKKVEPLITKDVLSVINKNNGRPYGVVIGLSDIGRIIVLAAA